MKAGEGGKDKVSYQHFLFPLPALIRHTVGGAGYTMSGSIVNTRWQHCTTHHLYVLLNHICCLLMLLSVLCCFLAMYLFVFLFCLISNCLFLAK